jgi:hypothetical protein
MLARICASELRLAHPASLRIVLSEQKTDGSCRMQSRQYATNWTFPGRGHAHLLQPFLGEPDPIRLACAKRLHVDESCTMQALNKVVSRTFQLGLLLVGHISLHDGEITRHMIKAECSLLAHEQ